MTYYALSLALEPNPERSRAKLVAASIESFAAVSRSGARDHLAILLAPAFAAALHRELQTPAGRFDTLYGMPCKIAAFLPEGWPFAYVPREALGLSR